MKTKLKKIALLIVWLMISIGLFVVGKDSHMYKDVGTGLSGFESDENSKVNEHYSAIACKQYFYSVQRMYGMKIYLTLPRGTEVDEAFLCVYEVDNSGEKPVEKLVRRARLDTRKLRMPDYVEAMFEDGYLPKDQLFYYTIECESDKLYVTVRDGADKCIYLNKLMIADEDQPDLGTRFMIVTEYSNAYYLTWILITVLCVLIMNFLSEKSGNTIRNIVLWNAIYGILIIGVVVCWSSI